MDAPLELIQSRIASPGWTPGKRDIHGLFEVWRQLDEGERESMEKRLAKLDAPSAHKAFELFAVLDPRSRGDLARPLLKSYLKTVTVDDVEGGLAFPLLCFMDSEARVRKAAAQAIGASWSEIPKSLCPHLVALLLGKLSEAQDPSERKAIIEALGKSSDSRALTAIKESGSATTKALLTLERDLHRGDVSQDRCLPDLLPNEGLVLWFTPGIDQVARSHEMLLGAESLGHGILKPEGLNWHQLKDIHLWRKAGVVIGQVNRQSPLGLASALVALADEMRKATAVASGGPVRVRLGRNEDRPRSFVWEFAEALSKSNCGLINDGRDAHWELRTVGESLVLLPLVIEDERFSWRDATADGASDPTIAAALVELARLKPNDCVYDPFCGAGTELILAARKQRSVRAIGTDINSKAITSAQEASAEAKVRIDWYNEDALNFDKGPFDVVITNPPFGMRTVRGNARGLLEEFLGTIYKRLSNSGRIVMLSHAPLSTIQWAEAGRLRFTHCVPVRLGAMNCELQCFTRR